MSEHGHAHADPHDPFQKKVALAMSVYAVLLAFVTMLTNQARTEALLLSNQAANEWSYFQSKSTKGMLVRAEADLLDALGPENGGNAEQAARVQKAHDRFLSEVDRYDEEKLEIKETADELVAEADVNKAKEGQFEYASVAVELGIVVATVALLLSSQPAFWISIALAVGGVGWTARTAMISAQAKHSAATIHGTGKAIEHPPATEGRPEANASVPEGAKPAATHESAPAPSGKDAPAKDAKPAH